MLQIFPRMAVANIITENGSLVRANLKHAAIIGAGQLGRRHLQGLVKSKHNLIIHVVDPFLGSRKAVEDYIASAEAATLKQVQIQIHKSISELSGDLDFVVIATTASERLNAIEQVISVCKIRFMVLEKFLFNDSAEYPRAEALIRQQNISAWVNTPRRSFEFFRQLREQTSNDRLLHFSVDGGEWGLCCNSVHFVDLAQYMSGGVELRARAALNAEDIVGGSRHRGSPWRSPCAGRH